MLLFFNKYKERELKNKSTDIIKYIYVKTKEYNIKYYINETILNKLIACSCWYMYVTPCFNEFDWTTWELQFLPCLKFVIHGAQNLALYL